MQEDSKKDDFSVSQQEEQQVLALVKRLQQQIIFLEKKVDILLSRSAQSTHEGKSFSKPYRSFGHSQHRGKERYGDHSRERDFSSGRPDRQYGEEKRGFEPRGKPFYRSDRQQGEESRGSEQREKPFYRFDKPQGQSRRPGQRNKPFFRHRRDRD